MVQRGVITQPSIRSRETSIAFFRWPRAERCSSASLLRLRETCGRTPPKTARYH
jgi:hypothetical protein